MHLIRRGAFRAVSSTSTSFISKPRSITTSSPFLLRSKVQSSVMPSVFRRFASDEANSTEEKSSVESADSEHGSLRSAVNSATESVSSYISDAAESLSRNAEEVKDAVADTAAGAGIAFTPREDRREPRPYGDRSGGDRGDRGGYGGGRQMDNNRGNDRGGYGGGRRTERFETRPPMDRVLVPTPGIYIGNLLFDVTASDLEKEFEPFGPIKSAIIATDARGLSKGFGYIEFENTQQATAAIEAKHQTVLEGRRLIVNYMAKTVRDSKPNPPSKTLFIGNLAFEMSDADLNKLFRDIRNVIDVRVAIDRRTGQPRGFAHADFVDVESAKKGLEALTGKEVYGRKLRVDFSAGSRETRGDGAGTPPRDGGRDSRDRF